MWIKLLDDEKVCLHQLRVTRQAFKKLCDVLVEKDDKWQWFKGALRAFDGTLIEITVPASEQGKYLDRKGSASDSRVLRDALTRRNNLKVPQNMYYLVDLGYTNGQGFLAPYRGTRYHLNLWRGNTPTNYKELFNLRQSAARNTIEAVLG
ncbi:hypothetical protein SLEP1_g50530 [Rubroshorea leprosula]|uniref:DDE Tnp4 domain-containing protein n=1 Tax=Rubroshorea leprosula TaxID=152421 RepID=A0AAV5M197_9ROSI|nr:hypothetical protein SLEP1_g50530 [Rubroshorea leprosula]